MSQWEGPIIWMEAVIWWAAPWCWGAAAAGGGVWVTEWRDTYKLMTASDKVDVLIQQEQMNITNWKTNWTMSAQYVLKLHDLCC